MHLCAVENEEACLKNHGRWLTIKMYDSGKNGWEGNALHMLDANLKEMFKWTLPNGKESTANLCLDYFGEDFSECYTLFMDAEGVNQEEVSWEFSVKTKKDKKIKEAKQEGGSPDESRLMWFVCFLKRKHHPLLARYFVVVRFLTLSCCKTTCFLPCCLRITILLLFYFHALHFPHFQRTEIQEAREILFETDRKG